MKRFRLISALFVCAVAAIFACNVYYLVRLYGSIREDTERSVMNALADTDIDDMWERAERHNRRAREYAGQTEGAEEHHGQISGTMNHDGDFVTSTTMTDGRQTRAVSPLLRDRSYTNQMVADMSRQMHTQMDPWVEMNFSITDSIFMARLADRRIFPEFVAIEAVNSDGLIVVGNPHVPRSADDFEVYELCVNPDRDLFYRAYISPLTRHVLHEMSGVIVTLALLMAVFAAAFVYLFRTVGRLRTLEEMKDDFTANMTHELKTPISIAYAANDALLHFDAASDAGKRETYLRLSLKQLKRLGELVENILAMSMERRKSLKLNAEHVDVVALAEEVAAAQRLRKDKVIRIDVEAPHAGVVVHADRMHLANVLNNLIDNAIKYSGEVVDIRLCCTPHGISVHDNGIGIAAKNLPYLFDKFYRVPSGNIHEVRGYGIGLYYVRSILDKMGWSIDVQSRPGRGSVFTITFATENDERENSAG